MSDQWSDIMEDQCQKIIIVSGLQFSAHTGWCKPTGTILT